jgi:hypothetical protein
LDSCSDSLGVNGADYIKSKPGGDTLLIDTMIDFKKVIIEKVITETDTVIKYIPVDKTYDNVYSGKYDFILAEYFNNYLDNPISEFLGKEAELNIVSFLNYNPLTPEISFRFQIDNSHAADDNKSFKNRPEILYKLFLNVTNMSAITDMPIQIKDLADDSNINLNIEMINRFEIKRNLEQKYLFGDIQITNRLVQNGQIRSLTINGVFMIPQNQQGDLKKYSIQFQTTLIFPAF